MVIHKRKKHTRAAAKTTHGWGSMKKRRGAGNRGGRGRSGSGARGDQKKPRYWKTERFGKHGFKSKSRMPTMNTINLKSIEDRAETLVAGGYIQAKDGGYVVDLNALGYNKLLSTGKVTKKLMITVDFATEKAVEKVSQAGGSVNLTGKKPTKADNKDAAEAKPAEEKKE